MSRLLPILLCLVATLPAAAQAPELRPFQEGVSWVFKSGFFNAKLAGTYARDVSSILIFKGMGHDGGCLTLTVTRPEGSDLLLLQEVYDYPETGPGSDCSPAVQAAAPPEARAYEITETTKGEVRMTTLVGNTGSPNPEYLHLLPVQPQAPMQWHWNTTQATFVLGALSKEQQESGEYNAHGQVLSTTAVAADSTGPREEEPAVHVRITVNGVQTDWWFGPEAGLIRYGGVNLGQSRELLEVEDPSDPGAMLVMDRRVFIRN
jgi:hypothetical protein